VSLETSKCDKQYLSCPVFNTYTIHRLFSAVPIFPGEAVHHFSSASTSHVYKRQNIFICNFFPRF